MTDRIVNPAGSRQLPPGQQLVAKGRWPVIGERFPANKDGPWRLEITGEVATPISWSLEQLREMPQTEMTIDIHCVTRWSKLGNPFSGVLLSDLLDAVRPNDGARFVSFTARSDRNHSTSLELQTALLQQTLIALDYQGSPLELDHGGPIRNVVPGRYFYKSVKWLESIEVLCDDKLGMWESESGYHNQADPWKEQRYMSPTLDKRSAAKLIRSRNFSNQDLRSIDASNHDLNGLRAKHALLRDANFRGTNLRQAIFDDANLSNAHFNRACLAEASFRNADLEGADFCGADLRGADFSGASLFGASFTASEDLDAETLLDLTTVFPDEIESQLTPHQWSFLQQRRSQSGCQ